MTGPVADQAIAEEVKNCINKKRGRGHQYV